MTIGTLQALIPTNTAVTAKRMSGGEDNTLTLPSPIKGEGMGGGFN